MENTIITASGEKLLNPRLILDNFFPLKFGSTVADFGCGTMGFFTFEAAKRLGNKGLIYAVDVQKDVVAVVADRAKTEGAINIKAVWSDVEIAGVTKINPVDYIFIITVLYQIQNKPAMLKETFRLLKDSGKVMCIDWKETGGPISPRPENLVNKAELENLMIQAGFKKEKDFEASSYHFGQIYSKA